MVYNNEIARGEFCIHATRRISSNLLLPKVNGRYISWDALLLIHESPWQKLLNSCNDQGMTFVVFMPFYRSLPQYLLITRLLSEITSSERQIDALVSRVGDVACLSNDFMSKRWFNIWRKGQEEDCDDLWAHMMGANQIQSHSMPHLSWDVNLEFMNKIFRYYDFVFKKIVVVVHV